MEKQIMKGASTSSTSYSFSWSNLKSHIVEEVGELLREEKFVDVTILCEHHSFRAHKVILSLASPLFASLLKNNLSAEPCISLSDVPLAHLTWILQYVYSGQASIPEEHFDGFMATATLLQITSLCNHKAEPATELKAALPLKRPAQSEGVSRPRNIRFSKRSGRKRGKRTPPPGNIPIIISTESVEGGLGDFGSSFTETSESIENPPQVFIKTQAVLQEVGKDGYCDLNQEVITIQTGNVDEMSIDEVVEVVTSDVPPISENFDADKESIGEVTITETQENPMRLLYTPVRACMKPHHSLAPKACSMCGKVYSNQSNLRQHIRLVHSSNTMVNCPLCGKDFKSELYMRRHLICAHNVTPAKKEPTTKESRRLMELKASPLKVVENDFDLQQQVPSEMDTAVENLEQSSEQSS
ncbi:zinc finger and BTB domain-containing protein 8A-like [Neocloeon triangulifer]|uniref:zinc finger and BTB domain-containing protein 8A-like n=1 Tax=Neocloeon triangulifer TaxID=2078957 RepID=UPI00286F69A2|nr:zinc finger and BTB domain-containing protein 8A-like [Neocloeon triangulifer]